LTVISSSSSSAGAAAVAYDSGPLRAAPRYEWSVDALSLARQSLDALPSMVWVYDRHLRICFVNLVGRKLLGLGGGELLGRRDEDLFSSTATDCYLNTLRLVATNRLRAVSGPLSLQGQAADARSVRGTITFTPVLDEHGRLDGVIACASELPTTTAFDAGLAHAFSQMSKTAILAVGLDGTVTHSGPATERLLGYSAGQLERETLAAIRTESNTTLLDLLRQPREPDEAGEPTETEARLRRADGSIVRVVVSSVDILDSAGERVGMAVTLRKARDTQADALAQSEALHVTVAGFAHDINNLLTVVDNYQSFVADGPLSTEQASDLKVAIEATRSGTALAARLLLLCKGQRATSTVVDVNEIAHSTARMLRPIFGDAVQLSIELADAPVSVRAAAGEIEQVIINLAINARDAMHFGSLTIHVSRRIVSEEASSLGLSPGKFAVIAVKDTGPGISSETLAHIFDPFFTTKALSGGTGLGLYMVKEVVTRLGGAVRIETEVGRGCEFFIYLPLVEDPSIARGAEGLLTATNTPDAGESAKQSSAPAADPPLPNQPIALLVDDNDEFRESLARVLGECEIQSLSAKTGLHALQVLTRVPVDIVIADQILPGMDGLQLLDAVRSRWPRCQRVLLTGHASPDVVIAAVNKCGVSKVLLKTMHPVLIRDEIERVCLDIPRLRAAAPR